MSIVLQPPVVPVDPVETQGVIGQCVVAVTSAGRLIRSAAGTAGASDAFRTQRSRCLGSIGALNWVSKGDERLNPGAGLRDSNPIAGSRSGEIPFAALSAVLYSRNRSRTIGGNGCAQEHKKKPVWPAFSGLKVF